VRCILCKNNSNGSRSVEHIISESLGNRPHGLAPGVVSDRCNNHFSRAKAPPYLTTILPSTTVLTVPALTI